MYLRLQARVVLQEFLTRLPAQRQEITFKEMLILQTPYNLQASLAFFLKYATYQ